MPATNDPTAHSGREMGAVPHSGGTRFCVWAPHASQVSVVGNFNHWADVANPLTRDAQGLWFTDVAQARVGDEYRYVIWNGPERLERIDPYAKDVTGSTGNGIIVDSDFDWGAEAFQPPAANELVVYEMHIGTFNDQPGGGPGDLTAVIEKLPYLKDLGVNAIQIMPSFEFPGSFSWGYNPSHVFAFESDYGGPRAFKELVRSAHALGMAVLFDVVYNHLGPFDLDLWRFDGWQENDRGGIYFYNDWRAETPWGHTRPDYGRPEVQRYLCDNALLWLEQYRVDGLRWDATAYIRNVHGRDDDPSADLPEGWNLMQEVNRKIKEALPSKIAIAEDLRMNPWITKDVDLGGVGFDAQWDAAFVHPVRAAITAVLDESRNLGAVAEALAHRYDDDAFARVIYTESHDEVANGKARVPHEIWPENPGSYFSRKRSAIGAALVLTAPGIPMIFQGQEILEDEWFRDTDPIDWSKKEKYAGILLMYRDLIRLRRNGGAVTRGLLGQQIHVHHVNDNDKVTAFHRWDRGGPRDDVVVLVNLANRPHEAYRIGFPRDGLWRVRFNSDWKGYSPDFGNHPSLDTFASPNGADGMLAGGELGIGPYSVVVLSQDE